MNTTGVRFEDDVVIAGGRRLQLDHPIKSAWVVGSRIIVLFDPNAELANLGQFRNLVAVENAGHQAWVAELPTSTTGDRYYRVDSQDPIVVSSFSSYDCQIDAESGRITRKVFTK